MDFQDELTDFYARYNVELIRAPEGFFTYAPFNDAYSSFSAF